MKNQHKTKKQKFAEFFTQTVRHNILNWIVSLIGGTIIVMLLTFVA